MILLAVVAVSFCLLMLASLLVCLRAPLGASCFAILLVVGWVLAGCCWIMVAVLLVGCCCRLSWFSWALCLCLVAVLLLVLLSFALLHFWHLLLPVSSMVEAGYEVRRCLGIELLMRFWGGLLPICWVETDQVGLLPSAGLDGAPQLFRFLALLHGLHASLRMHLFQQ